MLPQIQYPIHTIQVPSTKKKHTFRPFLVKEEKILLMAKESGEYVDMLRAIKQIVNNCCIDEKFNIDEISATDLMFLFIRLRAISVNNKVKQTYVDVDDNKEYTVEIDLDKVEIYQEKVVPNIVKVSKDMGLTLKYPPARLIGEDFEDDALGSSVIISCIEKIFDGNDIFYPRDYKHQDLIEFIENLPIHCLETINEFITKSPEIRYVVKYTNSLGTEKEIVLRTLPDFFDFR